MESVAKKARTSLPVFVPTVVERQRVFINANRALHDPVTNYWRAEERSYLEATRRVLSKSEQVDYFKKRRVERQGDLIVNAIKELFHHGSGTIWGDDQVRVFMAFLACCLPLIYKDTWTEEKARVLAEWDLAREIMYALVNMARRNGKTYVTSGTVAAFMCCIPGVKIAIFSTCRRTSNMMMQATLDQLEMIFNRGTHATRQDFVVVTKNMESVCFEGPDGTKRIIGCFPGSVRVSMCVCVCVCVCVC
jgi:hypothetical protein